MSAATEDLAEVDEDATPQAQLILQQSDRPVADRVHDAVTVLTAQALAPPAEDAPYLDLTYARSHYDAVLEHHAVIARELRRASASAARLAG